MNIEPVSLERSEAIGDFQALLSDSEQAVQALLQSEVGEVIGAEFVAEKRSKLFVLFEEPRASCRIIAR